jgi:hypothetical protein
MPELGTSGSVRGVRSNAHPYRAKHTRHRCSPAFGIASNFLTAAFAEVTSKLLIVYHFRSGAQQS